jgi:hypothetical protein
LKLRVLFLLAGLALAAYLPCSNADAAVVAIGSPLSQSFTPKPLLQAFTLFNAALPEGGANETAQINGEVVRWHVLDTEGGPFKLRVLRPAGGGAYAGVGASAAENSPGPELQTYETSLPIKFGDTIGFENQGSIEVGVAEPSGAAAVAWSPPLGEGSSEVPKFSEAVELAFNAEIQPYPTVDSLTPSSGPTSGGTSVTVTGSDLEGTDTVRFGSTPALNFTLYSEGKLTATAPSSAPGAVSVSVSTIAGTATAVQSFTYIASSETAPACTVPKLKGKKLKAAKKALLRAECRLGKVIGKTGKSAKVKKQKPAPGTVIAPGGMVNVTLK